VETADEKTYSQREVWTEVRLMKIEETQKTILGELQAMKEEIAKLNVRQCRSEQLTTFSRGWIAGAIFVAGGIGAIACEFFRRFF